jgi:hypothetical protein
MISEKQKTELSRTHDKIKRILELAQRTSGLSKDAAEIMREIQTLAVLSNDTIGRLI